MGLFERKSLTPEQFEAKVRGMSDSDRAASLADHRVQKAETHRQLEVLKRGPGAGATEADLEEHVRQKALLEAKVQAIDAQLAIVERQIHEAERRAAEKKARDVAAVLDRGKLRSEFEDYLAADAALAQKRSTFLALLSEACSRDVRQHLTADPLEGARSHILQVFGNWINDGTVRHILENNTPILIPEPPATSRVIRVGDDDRVR